MCACFYRHPTRPAAHLARATIPPMSMARHVAAVCLFAALASVAAPAQPAPSAAPFVRQAYFGPNEVRIDAQCRVHPDPALALPGVKPRPYYDGSICHLESVLSSEHIEQKTDDHQLLRYRVKVHEREFVLYNVAETPVIFVVEEKIPAGWVIDSDPSPQQMIGRTAYFPVHAQPGQSVRLHVGMRHTTALRPETF